MSRVVLVAKIVESIIVILGVYLVFSRSDGSPALGLMFALVWFFLIDGLTKVAIRKLSGKTNT